MNASVNTRLDSFTSKNWQPMWGVCTWGNNHTATKC